MAKVQARKKQTNRASYRKEIGIPKNMVLGFYGRLLVIGHCKAYCDLHKCYLIGRDIAERKCNKKKCKYKKELGKHKDIIGSDKE